MQYYIGFIAIFERPCWGYISHRLDVSKSCFFLIFRNIEFCDTSSVLARFWFSQIAKGPIGGTEFWILARFLCVFWTRHEIHDRLWPPPSVRQIALGRAALDHDSKELQNPTTTFNYRKLMLPHADGPRARRITTLSLSLIISTSPAPSRLVRSRDQ